MFTRRPRTKTFDRTMPKLPLCLFPESGLVGYPPEREEAMQIGNHTRRSNFLYCCGFSL
jgi:hypothetical protein